ncbi:glycosyltransferase family 4 protein [Salegentibacter maritimus]|uniref:Glycosyltransferase family 4 protein n=1 Tax=Salegentibacter maritimus TaxID=2794347 RepID=A0ABS0TIA4_9FLAO|nr:glycosyltransferase family 4 protein [Salegentibacter maritimus]MBI6119769.1 glycosyltransferase family 4 protein [Salegentibacter maritimus]
MKILFVINSLGSGGAERSTEVICDHLYEKDIPFEILCLDKRTIGVQERMQEKGYSINFIPSGNFIKQTKFIANYIKNGDFNLVHSILFRANLRTRFAKLWAKFIHLESLVNTTYSEERLKDNKVNQTGLKIYKFIDQVTARKYVDHFHSITEAVKQHYIEEVGLSPHRVTVIPRGRKPIIDSYEKRNLQEPIQLINVARHEFQKGQIYLIKAVKKLVDKGYNIELRFFGRDGAATKEMSDYIDSNNLNDYIFLEGFKDNVSEYLLESHLFVFPSLYEGLGGALIEAQAAGLPVACNDIPVLHEVVEEGVNAKFFDVHNEETIVKAISFFIENPEIREKYGKASLKNFYDKFLESRNNALILELYSKLCSNSGK